MTKFKLTGRRLTPGGMYLTLEHGECGGEAHLFVSNKSDLTKSWPLSCSLCFQKTTFVFGSPALGRRLLDLLKKRLPKDRFDMATDRPPSN